MPEGKYYQLISKLSGCAIGPEGGANTPGVKVVTVARNDADDRLRWYTDALTGSIRNKDNGLALHVNGDGTVVLQRPEPGKDAQMWVLDGETVKNRKDARVLDITGANTSCGAAICAWKVHGGPNQKWDTILVKPKYFYLKSEQSGKMLDIEGANRAAGAKVVIWDQNNGDNQQWYEDRNGFLRSKLNDFVPDCSGPEITMQPYEAGNNNRAWGLLNGAVAQVSNPSKVLDITGGSKANGAKLCAYQSHGGVNQKWNIVFA